MSTSLYNPMSVLGKTAKMLEHPYKGKVVQVDNDPNYIGRIKVTIPELYGDYEEGIEGILPWIYPRYYSNFSGLVKLDIPEKGDVVEVIFPYKNVYLGYYTNVPLVKSIWSQIDQIDPEAATTIKKAFLDNYPNVYGSLDKNLTGWYIDKVKNEVVLFQGKTKTMISIGGDGGLNLSTPKDFNLVVGGNASINVAGDITLKATNINSTATINNTGDVNITGKISATVDAVANGISLIGHVHPYTWTDSSGSGDTSVAK